MPTLQQEAMQCRQKEKNEKMKTHKNTWKRIKKNCKRIENRTVRQQPSQKEGYKGEQLFFFLMSNLRAKDEHNAHVYVVDAEQTTHHTVCPSHRGFKKNVTRLATTCVRMHTPTGWGSE
jgi:hypothetical protein